jgi:O-antigen/teichoic acid export membrane protein
MATRDSAPGGDSRLDPTRVRNQPSLTSSTGSSWLIVGGLFTLIACVVLGFLIPLQPAGLALVSVIVIVALYAAMIVVRFRVETQRRRLGWLATLMVTIAVVALVTTVVVNFAEWRFL